MNNRTNCGLGWRLHLSDGGSGALTEVPEGGCRRTGSGPEASGPAETPSFDVEPDRFSERKTFSSNNLGGRRVLESGKRKESSQNDGREPPENGPPAKINAPGSSQRWRAAQRGTDEEFSKKPFFGSVVFFYCRFYGRRSKRGETLKEERNNLVVPSSFFSKSKVKRK